MAASLLDSLNQLISPGFLSTVAGRLGENPQSVSRGMQGAATSILGGIASKTGDASMMSRIFSLVTSPDNNFRAAADPTAFADAAQASTGIGAVGSRFITDLFGDRASGVTDVVAKSSGLSATSMSSIMRMASPLVLGFLGRLVSDHGLDLSSFTSKLAGEKNNIMRAAPAGLAAALGVESETPRSEREVPYEAARDTSRESEPTYGSYRTEPRTPRPDRPRWVWPVVAALVVLALFWGARGRRHVPQMADTMGTAGGEVVAPVMPPTTPSPTPPAPSDLSGVRLPDGSTLSAAPGSIEALLVTFISDPSKQPDATSWFNFDRIRFENNSASLMPESDAQIANVAKILAAYPQVSVKVGGYTDNVGNSAANKRLSTQRAASVRQALIKAGVSANRLTSEGYGDQHPVGDNSTDAGRAQNRRIAMLVVRK